ncbi:hypothetical protein BKH06_09900 [Actinomyces naeslundii]|uniref:DUF6119 family protein n=1 Tax=Actinomyces naeslundii TaxID=1655 RepID=UPI00096D66E5|nr:DUF6119 family protein [Actinomyces naeslundii]OMG09916.1 hypothetical protein BKH06_09900 [Actinomyces naeslundii]
MAGKKNDHSRMTVYRLVDLPSLKKAIRDKYDNFDETDIKVGKRDSLLLMGATEEKTVRWAELVKGLSNETVDLKTSSPGAVLLIPEDDTAKNDVALADTDQSGGGRDAPITEDTFNAWAITFGIGFQLLDQRYIDSGFGKRVAIRCIDSTKLQSITKVTLDDRSKTDRSSIPSGATLRGFGFEEIGELATRLIAEGKINNIGAPDKNVTVRGADSLSMPLSKIPTKIVENLNYIKELLKQKPVTDELALLEKISQVPNKNKQYVDRLNAKLLKAIVDPESKKIALAWPHEAVDEIGEVQAFQLHSAQKRGRKALKPQDGLPTLDDLLVPIREADESERQYRFNAMSVMLLESTDGDEKSRRIPVKNWLSFETSLDSKRHFLHSGKWYIIEDDYSETIRRQTEEIFNRESPLSNLPSWSSRYADELAYNQAIAEAYNGICLDRKLISIREQKGRIEACDVLLKGGVFVHVKRVDSSAPASHLLAQALVSTEILTYDTEAQHALKQIIKNAAHNPEEYECQPKKVVVVMVKDKRALTADSLYTFTQVNLGRHDKALASRGVGVYVVPVVRDVSV